jgi:hypothetical protein
LFDHVTIRYREDCGSFLLDPDGNNVEVVNHDR